MRPIWKSSLVRNLLYNTDQNSVEKLLSGSGLQVRVKGRGTGVS
jgi:hypothetical protein